MTDHFPAGPSGTASWEERQIGAGTARPLSVLILPDAANDSGAQIYHVICATPVLASGVGGDPVFSLTLVLSRQPLPGEQNISPLIQQGILNFETSMALSPEAFAMLEYELPGNSFQSLYAHQADFQLHASQEGDDRLLAQQSASGSVPRAAITAHLTPAETLDVLSALDSVESSLWLAVHLAYRAINPDLVVRLSGSYASVYDFLLPRLDSAGEITRGELRRLFPAMLNEGVLNAVEVLGSGQEVAISEPYPDELFDLFMRMSGVLFTRQTVGLDLGAENNVYTLRDRPHPMFTLDIRQKLSGTVSCSLDRTVNLDQVIGGALEGFDRSRFIHLVAQSNNGGGTVPVPRLLRSGRSTPRAGGEDGGPVSLALQDGGARSLSLALQPSTRKADAQTLIASDLLFSANFTATSAAWWVDDLVIMADPASLKRGLPVVEDPNAVFWRDSVNSSVLWYAPVFELLRPAPNGALETSPFRFKFQRTGVTSSGKPALSGSVEFTIQKKMSAATKAALEPRSMVTKKMVVMQNLSVTLNVPFVDESDGNTRLHSFAAQVTESGDNLLVRVDLLNDWVRLCYGALAEPGFQSQPATIKVAYAFEAAVPVKKSNFQVIAGGKTAFLPVAFSTLESQRLGREPHFDAVEAAYRHPLGEVRLTREAPSPNGSDPAPVTPPRARARTERSQPIMPVTANPVIARRPTAISNPNLKPVVVSRPPLRPLPDLEWLEKKTEYARQTMVRLEHLPALFPCAELGVFYQETTSQGDRTVGCQDALQLGSTVYRQYEEMTALTHPQYRVYRSLQQPGRFLVMPAEYLITRFEPDVTGRAFQPAIIVYSVLDPENEANNRIVFQASLQPNLPPYLRREILATLTAHASDPVIEYPTEITSGVEYAWTVDQSINVEPTVVRTPDAMQVSLSTDLPGAFLLRTLLENGGVFGSVTFKLPDGTQLQSNLMLDLRRITGPWEPGPLQVETAGGNARLTNCINSPVDVSDLRAYPASGTAHIIPVDARLEPGGARDIPLGGAEGQLFPVYAVDESSPAALEEIRSLIEDVHTNVIFIDLINYANHNLSRVEIRARMKDIAGEYPVVMSGDPPRGVIDIILPLTVYLEKRILQFQVTKTFTNGAQEVTAWFDWDMRQDGNIISLSWEMIQQS